MAGPILSPEKLAHVRQLLKTGAYSHRQISELAGVGVATVSEIRGRTPDEFPARPHSAMKINLNPAKPKPLPPTVEDELAIQKRKSERIKDEQELKEAIREKSFRSFIEELFVANITPIPEQPKRRVENPSKKVRRKTRYPILHLSDWHYAEMVRSEAVLGLNEYDAAVTSRRAFRICQAFLNSVDDWEASGRFHYPELTVMLNGDFLTGTIHGLERHTDAPNVVRSTIQCGGLIALAIRDLASRFERVRVIGTVGNHGRLPDDRKVPTKDPTRSLDYLAYKYAQASMLSVKNVEWELPDSYGHLFQVGGHWCFQGHGHFLKQQLSIPALGVHRFMTAMGSTMSAAGKRLEYVFLGHFHNGAKVEQGGVETFINPSLIGTQEYGLHHSGKVNVPAQDCYIVDPELGRIEMHTLKADANGYEGHYELPDWCNVRAAS